MFVWFASSQKLASNKGWLSFRCGVRRRSSPSTVGCAAASSGDTVSLHARSASIVLMPCMKQISENDCSKVSRTGTIIRHVE